MLCNLTSQRTVNVIPMLILQAEPQAIPSQPIAGHLGWYTSAAPCPYADSLRPMLSLQAEPPKPHPPSR